MPLIGDGVIQAPKNLTYMKFVNLKVCHCTALVLDVGLIRSGLVYIINPTLLHD